jgi:predicted acetyltransferase
MMIKQIHDMSLHSFPELSDLYEEEFAPLTGAARGENGSYPISTPIDETHHGYLLLDGDASVGFAIVAVGNEPYDICEFFIRPEYRKQRCGEQLAFFLFDKFPGTWTVKQLITAEKATAFWIRVLDKYTGGDFIRRTYEDDKWGNVQMQVIDTRIIRPKNNYGLTK